MPSNTNALLSMLGIGHPILQAPMAGISTPALAAAVTQAGGLGALGIGAADVEGAAGMITEVEERTSRSLHVNVFAHRPARADHVVEVAWIKRLHSCFDEVGASPPSQLREIYRSFVDDDAMLALLVAKRPKVVSFHFGLPSAERIEALRSAGILLMASATNLTEARQAQAAGVQAIIAQGYEAGGHRGMFDPDLPDSRLGTLALVRILVREISLPIIAAGGIMDGAGIRAALALGAAAAQLGTAFVATHESGADKGYRAALFSEAAHHTVMTRAISGRPARSLANRFTDFGLDAIDSDIPAYPIAYDLGKALHAAGKIAGEHGFGAQWAGQGAPLARAMSAAELTQRLVEETGC